MDIGRERWVLQRSEAPRLERLVRRSGTSYAKDGQAEVFRVS